MSRIHRMSRGRKALLSLLLVGVIGTVAGDRHVLGLLGHDREPR